MAQDVLGLKSQGWRPKQLLALLLIKELSRPFQVLLTSEMALDRDLQEFR